MRWTARQIEAVRLAEIVYRRRLTGARAAPPNAPSEWIGWRIIAPGDDARRYLRRAVAGECTRCGGTPRAGRRTCKRCAEGQAKRAAALRARRKVAGRCTDCGAATSGGRTRCPACRDRYRGAGRWARPAAR